MPAYDDLAEKAIQRITETAETQKIAEHMAQQIADHVDTQIAGVPISSLWPRPDYVTGVDLARGADRGHIHLVKPSELGGSQMTADQQPNDSQTAVMDRWNRDPVAFARDIGLHLDRREEKALRDAMKGETRGGRRHRRTLERVRVKMEAALRRIAVQNGSGK